MMRGIKETPSMMANSPRPTGRHTAKLSVMAVVTGSSISAVTTAVPKLIIRQTSLLPSLVVFFHELLQEKINYRKN
jgi:hypothetical protein